MNQSIRKVICQSNEGKKVNEWDAYMCKEGKT